MTPDGVRLALVTGANRGLGFEASRQLLAKGLRVALAGRDEQALARAVDELGADADRAMTVRMDVTDVTSITRAHRLVEGRFGGVDVLVNNAAVLKFENEDALSIPGDAYRRTFETNVFGVVEVCRVFAPPMAQARYGRIVNVSSGAGQLATMSTYAPAYSMSKTALNALTRILAHTYSTQRRARKRGRSRVGAHRYGRSVGAALTSGRCRHHRLARDAARRWPIRRVLPRSARD
jgi:NAD(P)-dependent dehydrogenase (short-subunit alcohol dehydrogenase family)